MRLTPGDTYRQIALAMLDAADAADRDGPLPAATALVAALSGQTEELDGESLLTVSVCSVLLTALVRDCTARDALDALYKACA